MKYLEKRLLHYSNSEWYDVYKSTYSGIIFSTNQVYEEKTGDFYVRQVYFSNLGDNGVIILRSYDLKSLISLCTFENSSRINGYGGSIYISQGQSSIRKVCSFGSKSFGHGKFCFIEVNDNSAMINQIHDSSITFSNRGIQSGYATLEFRYGDISVLQNNITKNYCEYNAAFSQSNGKSMLVKFSIIDENYANSRICLSKSVISHFFSIIFINNSAFASNSYNGMFYFIECDGTFDYCYFADNKQNGQYLFGIEEPHNAVIVNNSYVEHSEYLFAKGKDVTIVNPKENTYNLKLLSTGLCPRGPNFMYSEKVNKFTELHQLKSINNFKIRRR